MWLVLVSLMCWLSAVAVVLVLMFLAAAALAE